MYLSLRCLVAKPFDSIMSKREVVEQIKLPKFYFTFHVNSLRFLGIEVIVKNESFRYRIYSFFALMFTFTFVCTECIELVYHTKNFDMLALVLNYAVSHFLGMIKVVVMYTNRKKIGDLMTSLHEGRYKPNEERGGPFERQCIKKILRETVALMCLYALSIFIVYSLGLVTSFKIWLNEPQEMWKLPFAPISLINTTYTPRFEIVYVYQAIGIFMISNCVYTSDVTVISIIAQVCAQLKILEHSLRTYQSRGIRRHAESKTKTVEQSVDDALQETIEYHYNILETVTTVEYLCNYLALCVFVANMILLCMLMYFTSLMKIPSPEFFMYFFYCFLVAIQVFLYCWWGNEMTLANESLAVGIAETYSPSEPISHAKALKLMMIRAQRPLCFTAGKFVPLSLETYKAVIKGSFSYFMVLRQVNNK